MSRLRTQRPLAVLALFSSSNPTVGTTSRSTSEADAGDVDVLNKLRGAGGQRALWTMVDQALSSLSTAVMSIVVAKVSSGTDYGRWSLAFVVYTFMIGVSRQLASTPFILHHSGDPEERRRFSGAESAGLSVLIGIISLLFITPVAAISGMYRWPLIVTGLFMAGLLLQDTWRMQLISTGRPQAATLQDFLVVSLQVLIFAGFIKAGNTSPEAMIVAWAIPTSVAAVFGIWQWRQVPILRSAWDFLSRHWHSSKFLVLEFFAVQGASQIAWMLVPVLGSAQDVGALRGGMTLLGTLNIVGNSVYMFALAENLRRGVYKPRPLIRVGMAVTAVIGSITILFGLVLIVLPRPWGVMLLGETWDGARATMFPLTLYMLGVAFSTGPQCMIRSLQDTRSTFKVNLVLGPMMLICVSLGQYLGGAPGAAWGFAASTVLTAPLWWGMGLRVVHRPRPRRALVEPTA